METLLLAFGIVYIVALCILLYLIRHNRKYYAPAKGTVSVLFVATGIAAYLLGERKNPTEFALMLCALLLCAVGDVMLGLANRTKKLQTKPFMAGFVSFAAAHIFFCVMLYHFAPLHGYDFLLPLVLLIIMWLLEWRDKVRLKSMRVPAYIYAFLVGLMAGKALQVSVQSSMAFVPGGFYLAAGALLFLVSDVILLFLYFGVKRIRALRYVNLISYYAGVFLIALSTYWM